MRFFHVAVFGLFLPIGSSLGCGGSSVAAQSTPTAPTAESSAKASNAASTTSASTDTKPLKKAGEAGLGDRTVCPTSGEEFVVTADSPKVEYNGKTYYFCCSGCDQKFARDPKKYLEKKPDA